MCKKGFSVQIVCGDFLGFVIPCSYEMVQTFISKTLLGGFASWCKFANPKKRAKRAKPHSVDVLLLLMSLCLFAKPAKQVKHVKMQNRVDMRECVLSKSRSLFVRLAADFTVRCLELGNENLGNFEISGNLFLSNAQTANCTVLIPSEAWNHGNAAVINKCWNRILYISC